MTRTIHSILQVLSFIISFGTVATNIVPPKYQPYVVLVVSAAQGVLAWYNHNFNPDGTPASVAYVAKLLLLFLLLGSAAMAQAPQTQPFVLATSGGTFNGQPVTIASGGVQLTAENPVAVAVVYQYVFNPNDSAQPHVGAGLFDTTFPLASIVPKAIKSKLIVDLTNYNLTVLAGAGVKSTSNGVGLPRTRHVVGDFGVSPSFPMPGGHVQVAPLYQILLGPHKKTDRLIGGSLIFTIGSGT